MRIRIGLRSGCRLSCAACRGGFILPRGYGTSMIHAAPDVASIEIGLHSFDNRQQEKTMPIEIVDDLKDHGS